MDSLAIIISFPQLHSDEMYLFFSSVLQSFTLGTFKINTRMFMPDDDERNENESK